MTDDTRTVRFGVIADDDTGATDAAGMLTQGGVRTLLYLGLSGVDGPPEFPPGFEAVLLGTQSRSVPAVEARARTARAALRLRAAGVERVQLKYSSTFDSTPEGNIGPSLDACLDALGPVATIACPALPVNGRTTYCGHHFVNGVPLSESPMRNHPLTPMTDANLVRWLARQTKRGVASIRLDDVRRGPEHLRGALARSVAAGAAYLVVDATETADLACIARATADWPLISGGSGITAEIPATMFAARPALDFGARLAALKPGLLVVSGSQSTATRAQNAQALAAGMTGIRVDVDAAVAGRFDVASTVAAAAEPLCAGGGVLVYAETATAEALREMQARGRALGLTEAQTGDRIADALAAVAAALVAAGQVGRLVISGGETSGAVCRACGFGAMEAGLPVAPGVPYCFPLSHPGLMVTLKSGNFGGPDFYRRVAETR